MTPDQLSKTLESQGIRPETLKERIKSEMVWTSLVRGRYKESLQVGEKEVAAAAAVEVKGDDKDAKLDTENYEYKMQPIVLIVPRGSAPAVVEARQKEAEAPARPDPDLRRGQRLLQIDAERRDPRDRDQNLGRSPRCSS